MYLARLSENGVASRYERFNFRNRELFSVQRERRGRMTRERKDEKERRENESKEIETERESIIYFALREDFSQVRQNEFISTNDN